MKIFTVTPEIRRILDPDSKVRVALNGLTKSNFNTPSALVRQPDDAWNAYVARMGVTQFKKLDSDYVAYNHEMLGKTGAQGGRITLSRLKEIILPYYENPDPNLTIHPDVLRARDYLIQRIQYYIGRDGPVNLQPYVLIRGTAGGLPSTQPKGSFDAETLLANPEGHILPAYPWFRRMRGKDRSIFVDAAANVRKLSPYLTAARKWLVTHFPEYFAAWQNPRISVNPLITECLKRGLASVEEDYKGMDIGFTFQVVKELVLPVYRAILGDQNLLFEAWIEELFNQPLYFGDEIWTGLHALFSGQNPTNDFETIFTVILQIAVKLALKLRMAHLALGDDATMFVKKEYAVQAHNKFVEYAKSCEMQVHDDGVKNRIAYANTRFCRRCYSLSTRQDEYGNFIGYYPSSLCVNSICRPEKMNHSIAQAVSADLQRLDNICFQPEWAEIKLWLSRWYIGDLSNPASEVPRDWWERLYGEQWSPVSSPSFCLLNGLPLPKLNYEPLDFYSDFNAIFTDS